MNTYKAVIFDRDGTLNDMASGGLYYVLKPKDLVLYDDVLPCLKKLRALGVLPFVFTQQNGIGKGELSEEILITIHKKMQADLDEDARIEKFYHAPSNDHPMAKPGAGMIDAVRKEYGLERKDILVVGDSLRDYQSALSAGVEFVKIDRPGGKDETWPDDVRRFKSLTALIAALF